SILKKNLDIFAWQPSDMTRVPWSVAEYRLNIREGYSPVRQKKRGQAPERSKAIQAEVQKLVEAGIMREVYYHDWLSNPVMWRDYMAAGITKAPNDHRRHQSFHNSMDKFHDYEVIKSSDENLIPILSEFKGIPGTMCDVHLVNNPTPLEAKDHFETVINSNDDYSSSDDDSLYFKNIEYVEASPHDYEFISLEVEKIVIPEDEEIEDDNLREKLLKVNLLIAKIEALKDNPTPSSEFLTKSSFTSPKSVLEGTNTFHNSLPEFENFCFDWEEISSGSTTTHSDISLPEYEGFSFYDDHIEEISSGSTTTQSNISLPEYDSFIFDLLHDQFPPTNRSDLTHEEFGDELAHIISPPEYDCFYFGNLPDPGELISRTPESVRTFLQLV
nr:retrotransposon protein, putative, unclassified [Tanacetum cinerariifolium]